jgi:hypothetical protein
MRMMVRWTVPAEPGNAAITDGTMSSSIESLMQALKPEAAYFFANDGMRSGMMVFDMQDSSQIPHVAEPLFQAFNANVEILPVMNADDLNKALSSLP